jgi:type IV secretion system protein VirB6
MSMKLKFLIGLIIGAFLLAFAYGITGLIGTYKLSSGCLLRYPSTTASTSRTSVENNEFALRADANYSFKEYTETSVDSSGSLTTVTKYGQDPTKYGSWYKVDTELLGTQKTIIQVSGEISLCRGYIPQYNIQSNSDLDNNNKKIPIPRIDEATDGIPLILDAKNGEWRNVVEAYQLDKIQVYLGINYLPKKDSSGTIISDVNNIAQSNRFTNSTITADCREGKNSYSPICGRYSPYNSNYFKSCDMSACGQYCDKCVWYWDSGYTNAAGKERNYNCSSATSGDNLATPTAGFKRTEQYCCKYGAKSYSPLPNYDSAFNTAPRNTVLTDLLAFDTKYNSAWSCLDSATYINNSTYQDINTVWFTATDAAGLVYRFNSAINPSDKSTLGSSYSFSNVPDTIKGTEKYKLIYDPQPTTPKSYLQYRLVNSNYVAANQSTGGYVLYVKQTKCRRENGAALTDEKYNDRGRVKYLLLDQSSKDPNVTSSLASSAQSIAFDSDGQYQLPAGSKGFLWLKIDNKADDYKESFGSYSTIVKVETPIASGGLTIFSDLFALFKTKMVGLSQTFFKNMTCYGTDQNNCTNYFNYLRGMLILYIMTTGLMFLLGMTELNQRELVIITVKVAIISGLMNEKTYNYIDSYFIPLITQAADTIIGNLSSMSLFVKTTTVNNVTIVNPFSFVDELITRIFLDPTFSGQFVALLSFGSHGIIYFIIVAITMGIAFISIFRAVTVYIMSYVAQCLLIMLAPIFLSFMLFDYTRTLFEKWLRYFIRYSLEPIILIIGLVIFVQLFTIYLDYLLNYSVCWKCAIAFTIPFSAIPGLENLAMSKVPLFCINWFVPWGHDAAAATVLNATGDITSVNFTNVIALLIIAYGMKGYIDLAEHLVASMANVEGPSTNQAGKAMASSIGQGFLKKFGLDQEARQALQNKMSESISKRIQQKSSNSSDRLADKISGNMRKKEDRFTDKVMNKIFGNRGSISGSNIPQDLGSTLDNTDNNLGSSSNINPNDGSNSPQMRDSMRQNMSSRRGGIPNIDYNKQPNNSDNNTSRAQKNIPNKNNKDSSE